MPPTSSANAPESEKYENILRVIGYVDDPNVQFGGYDERKRLEKQLLWKLDLRMSILVVISILNSMDRNNVGVARLRGFQTDLHLEGQQFPTLLSILYVGFIIMQIPSNMFLNYIGRPSLYIPACMIVWGIISCLVGITKNFVGALLARFFLGFIEAVLFPGVVFLISKWYKREEVGLRTAMFYCGSIISNAFGSLIASGILGSMNGVLGHASWRWLFYIEGSLTILVSIPAIFILPDFPTTTRWLTPQERQLALLRMAEDAAGEDDQNETEQGRQSSGFYFAITDLKVWWLSLSTTIQVISLSFTPYFPTLTATLGYNPTVTLLLCAPPFISAAALSLYLSRRSDKAGERFFHISGAFVASIVGFIIASCTMNTVARYISLFLMAQSYAGSALTYTWISNSFPRPPSKRAVCLAIITTFVQLGTITGAYVWPTKWGPTYRYSCAICMATSGGSIVMNWFFRQHLANLNRKIEAEEKEKGVRTGYRYFL